MEAAERIARDEHRATKLAVISGVGTRHYYRRLGFELEVRPASGRPVSTCCELCTSQAVARLVCTACAGVWRCVSQVGFVQHRWRPTVSQGPHMVKAITPVLRRS